MRSRSQGRVALRAAVLALALMAAGCSHMHWPWHHPPPPPPAPVHELDVSGAAADAYPQYWKRNTLLLDLRSATGTGKLTLKPIEGTTWPVRLAVRVTPGAFARLEVHGDQRLSLPITASGAAPIDLEFPPSLFTPKTAQITVSWGPVTAPTP